MDNSIIRGFTKLTQFSGRDTRGEFWPFAGLVFALVMILGAMVGGLVMTRMIADIQPYATDGQVLIAPAAAATPSDQVLVEVVEPYQAPQMPMPDFTPFFLVQAATVILSIGLLAAAVSRRLHDTGKSAYWGLMPVPFVLGGIFGMFYLMAPMMAGRVPNFGLFGLLFLNNIAYLVTLVTLIVMLAQRGAPGANRHGEARGPARIQPVEDWSTPS